MSSTSLAFETIDANNVYIIFYVNVSETWRIKTMH